MVDPIQKLIDKIRAGKMPDDLRKAVDEADLVADKLRADATMARRKLDDDVRAMPPRKRNLYIGVAVVVSWILIAAMIKYTM